MDVAVEAEEAGTIDLDAVVQDAERLAWTHGPNARGSRTPKTKEEEEEELTSKEDEEVKPASVAKLFSKAALQLARNETTAALQCARQTLLLCRQAGHQQNQAAALLLIAMVHIQRQEPEQATRATGDAVLMLKERAASATKVAACLTATLSRVHLLKDEFSAAKRRALEAEQVYSKLGELCLAAEMLQIVARSHLGLGQHAQAAAVTRTSRATFLDLGDVRRQARAWDLLAEIHLKALEPAESIKAGIEAQKLFHGMGDRRGEAVVLHTAISAELLQKRSDEALKLAFDMVRLFELPSVEEEQAGMEDMKVDAAELREAQLNRAASLYEVADVYLFRKEPWNALTPATTARKLYRESGDTSREVIMTETLIKAHTMASNPREAITCIYELVEIYQRAGKRPDEAATWLSLAKIHAERLMPQKASVAAEQALAHFRELGDIEGVREAFHILGALEEVKDKLRFALMPAREAMDHYSRTGDPSVLLQGAQMAFEGRRSLAQLDAFASGLGRTGRGNL